jgi:flavin reductase (DIM6/NTAB) family NADH-FMN oxidoreductase RutF
MHFHLAELKPLDRYKLLSSTITPRPIAWVTTLSENGRPNAAPFSFFNVFGEDPPVLGFSVNDRSPGDRKDTGRNVRQAREFVVNLVPLRALDEMNITAAEFGPDVDELYEAGLTPAPSLAVKAPLIAESPVSFECRLLKMVEFGPARSLVIGEILVMHVRDDAVIDAERFYIDNAKLALVGRMHGNRYIDASTSFELPRVDAATWRRRERE